MKRLLQSAVLAAIVAGNALGDDGLDEALAALKNKRHKTRYSTNATLHDRNLVVQAEPTEEDKALDARLRELEKEMDNSPVAFSEQPVAPRRVVPQPQNQQDNNWLISEILNAEETTAQEEDEGDWMMAELDRQESIRLERDTQTQGNTEGNFLFSNPYGLAVPTADAEPERYGSSLQNVLSAQNGSSGSDQRPDPVTSYFTPTTTTESPFSLTQPTEEDSQFSFTMFPQHSSDDSSAQPALDSTLPSWTSTTEPQQTGPSWNQQQQTEPVKPIDQIRKASPAYQDPFSDDFSPEFKSSIWE
jgi:hypothetical protein